MQIGRVLSVHRYPVKSMGGETLDAADIDADGVRGDRAYALRDETAREIRGGKRLPRLMEARAHFATEPAGASAPAAQIRLPDGSETSTDDAAVHGVLSRWLGTKVTLHPRLPASDKDHYRRVQPGASLAGVLARSPVARKVVAKLATLGPGGAELQRDFAREPGEPFPDLAVFPPELFEYVSPPGTYFDAFPLHLITTASLAALRAKEPQSDWDPRRFRANLLIETDPSWTGLVEASWAGRTLRLGEVELTCTVPTPRCSMVMQAHAGVGKDPSILRTIVREADQNLGIYARVRKAGRVSVGSRVELL